MHDKIANPQPGGSQQPNQEPSLPPQNQQPTVDIEALKKQAQERRQAAEGNSKQPEDYKSLFSKRYFIIVSILLIFSAFVFGAIIFLHLVRG